MDRANNAPSTRSKTGTDFLQLDLSEVRHGGRASWLVERVRDAITGGHLTEGDALPPSRVLAAELGVSRGVVSEAYRRLTDDGLVAAEGRRGTLVQATPLPVAGTDADADAAPPEPREPLPLDARGSATDFGRLRGADSDLDLSPGLPDLASFPRAAWLRAERAVLDQTPHRELGYSDPRGTLALRRAVCTWLARTRGIRASPDEVQVVAGVAQAIALLARLLEEKGVESVAVEDPGSLGARQQLHAWRVRTVPVPVDQDGLDVEALAASGAPAVMTTPAHQFPTGVVLTGERRRELAAWAQAGGLVFEDDYDAEHRYDRPPAAALRAHLPDHVYYAGSVSKTLAPALRIGWVLAPPAWRDRLAELKRDADLGSATLPQLTLAHLMTNGDLERHLRVVRRRHRQRRDAMVEALGRELPDLRVEGAAAGLHLTVRLPDDVDDLGLAAACLERGVKVHPLRWHRVADGPPGLVLGYAASSPAELTRATAVVAAAVRASGRRGPR